MHSIFIIILIFLGGVNNQPAPDPPDTFNFHCDTPDEWLNVFKGNLSGRSFRRGEKWPNGIVKYRLHKSLTAADKVEVRKAFEDISSKTCIKFQARSVGDVDFTEISVNDTVCGIGHLCKIGGPQFAQFGQKCRRMTTMVHELGHNLCLGHEHTRVDRDEYVDFRKCAEREIPGKNIRLDTRGTMYDYGSQMHYQCGFCNAGWPKVGGGDTGLCRTSKGLSVIDADRLNEFYECGGCHGHRWIQFEKINENLKDLTPLGLTQDGRRLYACRGQIQGKIAVGKYVQKDNLCYLPFEGEEYRLEDSFEVLSVPDELKPYYMLEPYHSFDKLYGVPIKGGRSVRGDTSFVASGLVIIEASWEKSVGEMFEGESHMNIAYFPWRALTRNVRVFAVLTCTASF